MDAVDRHEAVETSPEPRILRTIRPVGVDELFLCIPLGHAFYEEASLPGHLLPRVFVETWHQFLSSGVGQILGLWQDGTLIGAIGGLLARDPNTGQLMAQELFWFVAPEVRTGMGAIRLYKAFERWARTQGALRLVMTALAGSYAERLGAVYRTLGFRLLETNYVKDLP